MTVVTVAPVVEADYSPPRVRLNVTDTGSSPARFSTTVMRTGADGLAEVVRTNDGGPLTLSTSGSNRVGVVYDYEAPQGEPVTYSTVESPTVVSAPVTVDSGRVWLIHPGVPGLSMPVTVGTLGERSRSVTRGVHRPIGRRAPIVHTDGARHAAEWELTLVTLSVAERADLDVILDDASPLLLSVPADRQWGLVHEYVAVGDVGEARVSRIAAEVARTWPLPLTVVDRPAGGSQSERTLADIEAIGTLAQIEAAYPTLYDLMVGP